MLYLDTSVLLAYTLTKTIEPQRYEATRQLFEMIERGVTKAITSFYALHELLVVAITNTEPDWQAGSELARDALREVLSTRTLYVPIPRREDKVLKARLFSALRDATDVPHAVAAHTSGCTTIVAYDEHFRAISHLIPYKTPEDVLAELDTI
jgi:predicted nucleic acid-binding protein